MTAAFLSRDELMRACERQYHTVEVKGVGNLRMQTPNALEQSDITAMSSGQNGQLDIRAFAASKRMVCCKLLVESDGNRMFKDDDFEELGTLLSPDVVNAVYDKYRQICESSRLSDEVSNQKKAEAQPAT